MHIPDGYLSPQTYVPAYAVMVPIWGLASSRLKKALRARQMPLLALGAAFSFVIMMFNVLIPGGTTGHAVGAVLIAILLGPWAATIAVSLALIVQAMLFGDGGITAIGANCFNMAVVMPWTGWAAYRLIAGNSAADSRRRLIAGAVGGYVGLNAAALTTAVMFGIQPLIARGADGHALYSPFGLTVAVPIMAAEHLLVFGFVEAIVTGLVLAYLQRTDPSMIPAPTCHPERSEGSALDPEPRAEKQILRYAQNDKGIRQNDRMVQNNKVSHGTMLRGVVVGLLLLVLLTPLGLYLPAKLRAGSAWGEWSAEEVREMVGYAPKHLDRLGSMWKAPMPDYALPGQEDAPLGKLSLFYVLSGVAGAVVVVVVSLGAGRLIRRGNK